LVSFRREAAGRASWRAVQRFVGRKVTIGVASQQSIFGRKPNQPLHQTVAWSEPTSGRFNGEKSETREKSECAMARRAHPDNRERDYQRGK